MLRKKPNGAPLPSAHGIDWEHRVIAALGDSEVPIARALRCRADGSVIGTPFCVMAFVEGRVLWGSTLPGCERAERSAIYEDTNRVVAALNGVDPAAVGLVDYGRSGGFFARQIGRWAAQYQASVTEPIAAMDRLIEWPPAHVPPNDETGIFHGDLCIDNMILHPTEPCVLAVLDWELSTLGHQLADLAYQAMPWCLTAAQFHGMAGVDHAALDIPDPSIPRTGSSTWPAACSIWPRSCRAS